MSNDREITPLTIGEQWARFEEEIIPKDAAPIQIREMRRAFYTGVAVMMQINIRLTEPDISEDQGCRILDRINDELRDFAQAVREGKA